MRTKVMQIPGCDIRYQRHIYIDGHYFATLESGYLDHLERVQRIIDAHDDLVSLARDAYSLADDRTDTAPEPCNDTEMLSLMVSAKSVLEKVAQ